MIKTIIRLLIPVIVVIISIFMYKNFNEFIDKSHDELKTYEYLITKKSIIFNSLNNQIERTKIFRSAFTNKDVISYPYDDFFTLFTAFIEGERMIFLERNLPQAVVSLKEFIDIQIDIKERMIKMQNSPEWTEEIETTYKEYILPENDRSIELLINIIFEFLNIIETNSERVVSYMDKILHNYLLPLFFIIIFMVIRCTILTIETILTNKLILTNILDFEKDILVIDESIVEQYSKKDLEKNVNLLLHHVKQHINSYNDKYMISNVCYEDDDCNNDTH